MIFCSSVRYCRRSPFLPIAMVVFAIAACAFQTPLFAQAVDAQAKPAFSQDTQTTRDAQAPKAGSAKDEPLVGAQAIGANELGSHSPPVAATGAERLLVEQVEELAKSNQIREAINTLEKLFEQGDGRVIEAEGLQRAATQVTQRYVPIRQWSQNRLGKFLVDYPDLRESYSKDHDDAAAAALTDVLATNDLGRARQAAERFSQTSSGSRLQLLLTDLYLERGWGMAALQTMQRQFPFMRYPLEVAKDVQGSKRAVSGSLAWQVIAEQFNDEEQKRAMGGWHERLLAASWQTTAPEKLACDLLQRTVDASVLSEGAMDRGQVRGWTTAMAKTLSPELQKQFSDRAKLASSWQVRSLDAVATNETDGKRAGEKWSTFAGDSDRNMQSDARFDPAGWPAWNHALERYSGSSDRTSASKPRVAETEAGLLSYHPTVYRGRVYLHELTRIVAYDLRSGAQWPEIKPPLPLFDSHIAPAALQPLGYPMVGAVRGTVTVHDDCLYARIGSPVTGWSNGEKSGDGSSISYIVGIDLQRQGSLLKGFPLHLSQFDFGGSEPEGCPIIFGDQLIVTVAKRDNVGLRRSVASFDRFSGQLIWKSPALANGTVEGTERANLLSHQLLTLDGGRLFYNTNLGSVACLDATTGQIEWLVRYRRREKEKQAYPQPDRFRYRDLNPCVVHGGLVYCAPQDCPEIFALDAITGDLVWSTSDAAVADAVHVLGVANDNLIVSGDRLIWLDRHTGLIQGRFPAAGTSGNVNALPSPRGLGRGLISNGEIYWPTANEIFVFDASIGDTPSVDSPPMVRRIRLDTRGSEGGNLVGANGWLLIATPSRLMAFAPQSIAGAEAK